MEMTRTIFADSHTGSSSVSDGEGLSGLVYLRSLAGAASSITAGLRESDITDLYFDFENMKTTLVQVCNERGGLFCGEDGDSYSTEVWKVIAEARSMGDAEKLRSLLAHDQKLKTSKLGNSIQRLFYQDYVASRNIRIRESLVRGLSVKLLQNQESYSLSKTSITFLVTNPFLDNLSVHVQDAVVGALHENNVILSSIKVDILDTSIVKFVYSGDSAHEHQVSRTIPARRRLTLQELMDLEEVTAAKLFIEEVMMAYNYTGPMFQASTNDLILQAFIFL
jgi:hypothetical protein